MTTYQPKSNATADLNFNSEIEALARLSCITGKKQERNRKEIGKTPSFLPGKW